MDNKEKQKATDFIREHEYYYTPEDNYSRWVLGNNKLPPENYKYFQELSRFFYHQMIGSEKFVDEEYQDLEKIKNEAVRDHAAKKTAFYNELFENYVPGYTPSEKAIFFMHYLQSQDPPETKGKPKSAGPEEDEDFFTEFQKNVPEKDKFESSTLNLLKENHKRISDFKQNLEFFKKMSMVDGFGASFEIKKSKSVKRVPHSIQTKQKKIVEFEDVIRSPLYQMMFPDFIVKLAQKDLICNMPVISEEYKQKIIMLVDFSGSMHCSMKQDWVMAILANRLEYVIKEECELFFSFFLTEYELTHNKFKFTHLYNKQTAMDFWKTFNDRPSGGDTQVGKIIELIKTEIEDNKKLFNLKVDLSNERPEILVINDGADTVKADKFNWKTNAITISSTNDELKQLCERTGGSYVAFT